MVTAAHCVHDVGKKLRNVQAIEVYLGIKDLKKLNKPHRVERVFYPKNYQQDSLFNDIAILRLKKRVNFGAKVSPICLSDQGVAPNELLTVIGFGRLGPNKKPAQALMQVNVEYVDSKFAAHASASLRWPFFSFFQKRHATRCCGTSSSEPILRSETGWPPTKCHGSTLVTCVLSTLTMVVMLVQATVVGRWCTETTTQAATTRLELFLEPSMSVATAELLAFIQSSGISASLSRRLRRQLTSVTFDNFVNFDR